MRRAHLVAETNVKMIGALALLAACVQMVIAIVMLPKKPEATAIQMAVAGAIAACGVWLLQLQPRGRLVYTALSVIGLCGLLLRFLESGLRSPHPTHLAGAVLFSCLFLFLLWSEKVNVVLSPEYRGEVIPATPHIKYKPSAATIVLLVLLAAAVLGATVMGFPS